MVNENMFVEIKAEEFFSCRILVLKMVQTLNFHLLSQITKAKEWQLCLVWASVTVRLCIKNALQKY